MMTKTLVPTQGGQSGHMTFKAKSQALISIKANEGVWEGLKRSKPREHTNTPNTTHTHTHTQKAHKKSGRVGRSTLNQACNTKHRRVDRMT